MKLCVCEPEARLVGGGAGGPGRAIRRAQDRVAKLTEGLRSRHCVGVFLFRHRVKSGITGWAQVNGLRGETSLQDRVEWDNYYIENWSLWLDLKIALKTISCGLANGGMPRRRVGRHRRPKPVAPPAGEAE